MNLRIDPEFRNYLGALDEDSRKTLEESLRAEGCRDALVVWPQPEGDPILLDGHNRHGICERLGIGYRTVDCPDSVTDRVSAAMWIVRNQRGRRNLTRDELHYFCGRVFSAAKKRRGGNGSNQHTEQMGQNEPIAQTGGTAQRIGEKFGLSASTVKRAEKFADQVDAIAAEHGPEAKREILSGRKSVSDYAPQPEPFAQEEDAPPEPEAAGEALSAPTAPEEGETRKSVSAKEIEAAERVPTPEEQTLARIRALSDGECTLEMARNAVILPGQDCGATAKPVPLPENASPNYADPEVLRRDGDPFGFAVAEMERHALAARTALIRNPPPEEDRPRLLQRLAALEAAIRDLSGSLQAKE